MNVTNVFKQNGTREQIETYIQNLTDIIQPLNPRLVYFYQNDIEEALRKVGDKRGERWVEIHTEEKTRSAFAQKHGLSGYRGMVQFNKLYRELTDHLFEIVDLKKLSIENSAGDWKAYNEQVFEFISLAPYDESLQLGNAQLNHTKKEMPSRMCFDNQTDRFFVVYDWVYKKPMAQYRFEILPHEKRFHDALKGERYRLHDANTGEIVQDVLVCQSRQTVPINPPV